MHASFDTAHPHASVDLVTDTKDRRKLLDQKRMAYRRAIEDFVEQRRLQQDLADYPELLARQALSSARVGSRRSAPPSR